jgi:hypothetical protein
LKTKLCRMCKQIKNQNDFYRSNENLDGLFSYCKECSLKRWRAYNHSHRELRAAKGREYARKNMKIIVAKNKEYRKKNKEKCNAYSKKWALKNIEKVKARQLYNAAKTRAKNLGLKFDLTKEFIYKKLIDGVCEYTGLRFVIKGNSYKRLALSPSIDRKIPRLGYTQKNIAVVCWAMNGFKSSHTIEEIIPIAKAFILKTSNDAGSGTQGDPAAGCPPSVCRPLNHPA